MFNWHPEVSFSGLAVLSICNTIYTLCHSIYLPLSHKVLIKNQYTLFIAIIPTKPLHLSPTYR